MEYDGNHVSEIFGGGTCSYDSNGNLTENTWNCLQFSYNVLNLPCTAKETWGRQRRSLTYTYLADGTKVSAVIDGGEGLRYSGNFVYAVSADGSETLESVGWDEGRMIVGSDGTVGQDQWFVRDHLGNVRSVVDLSAPEGSTAETALVEQSDYLPFGTRIAVTSGSGATDNRYRYAGKEEQRFGTGPSPMDLEHLDFGARFYDPFTARWTTPDPLASKYPSISPYAYCGNDPVNKVDPTGMNWYSNDDDYLWVDSTGDTYTDGNGKTWTNVGSSISIDMGDGRYQNWFENVGFQSNKAFDAEKYIISSNHVGEYLSSGSNLCDIGKQKLFNDSINYGRQAFLGHPVTQAVIATLCGVALDGIVATSAYVSSCSLPWRVFWSGGTMNEARAYAVSNGMTTLEMTNPGGFLTWLSKWAPKSLTDPLWKLASKWYANSTTGTATVILREGVENTGKGIWNNIEKPILEKNGVKINRIIIK